WVAADVCPTVSISTFRIPGSAIRRLRLRRLGAVIRNTWPFGSPKPYWTLHPSNWQTAWSTVAPPCTRTIRRVSACAGAAASRSAAAMASQVFRSRRKSPSVGCIVIVLENLRTGLGCRGGQNKRGKWSHQHRVGFQLNHQHEVGGGGKFEV